MSAPLIAATLIGSQNAQAAQLRDPVETAVNWALKDADLWDAQAALLEQYRNPSDTLFDNYQESYARSLAHVAVAASVAIPDVAKKKHMAPAPEGREAIVQGVGTVLREATFERVGAVDNLYSAATGAPARTYSGTAKQGPLIARAKELGYQTGDGYADLYVARDLFSPPFEVVADALGGQPVEEIDHDTILTAVKKLVVPHIASERRLLSDTIAAWNSKRHPLQALRRRK